MKINRSYLYTLSFLEGGAVMAAEVLGAKLLAPYFGTSLYVWAAALGVTLGGLMTGYFVGGIISAKTKIPLKVLYLTLIAAGIFIIVMPWLSHLVMGWLMNFPLTAGALLSLTFFLFPPLILMGMVSPMLVGILSKINLKAGRGTGNIYAISTLGGILFTFALGFYIIPEFGIKIPAMVSGILLAGSASIGYYKETDFKEFVLIISVFVVAIVLSAFNNQMDDEKILFKKEGILGEVKVVEFDLPDASRAKALLVNNTLQTVEIESKPDFRYWNYIDYIDQLIPIAKKDQQALLLGVGGGTLYKILGKKGYEVVGVEFDKEIVKVAKKYFSLPDKGKIYIDDARHFIKKSEPDNYDLIIVDILKGESIPEHILTVESFREIKNILKKEGRLIINFYGYTEGDIGRAARSVAKTIESAKFSLYTYSTPGTPDFRNTLFLAFNKTPEEKTLTDIEQYDLETEDGYILTDLHPRSNLFSEAALRWRKLNNEWYAQTFEN